MTQESTEKDQEKKCPFAGSAEVSQAIRRQDLVDLGSSFLQAMEPLRDIVKHMRGQVANIDRLQRWLFTITALLVIALVLLVGNMLRTSATANVLQRTAAQLDVLEQRISAVNKTTIRAATASEAVQRDAMALVVAQESEPTVELSPEPDPVKARTAPLRIRVLPPKISKKEVAPVLKAAAAASAPQVAVPAAQAPQVIPISGTIVQAP